MKTIVQYWTRCRVGHVGVIGLMEEVERLKMDHHALGKWTECKRCTQFFQDDENYQGKHAEMESKLATALNEAEENKLEWYAAVKATRNESDRASAALKERDRAITARMEAAQHRENAEAREKAALEEIERLKAKLADLEVWAASEAALSKEVPDEKEWVKRSWYDKAMESWSYQSKRATEAEAKLEAARKVVEAAKAWKTATMRWSTAEEALECAILATALEENERPKGEVKR